MTTSTSPMWQLRAQADKIAHNLKAIERGEKVVDDPRGVLSAALAHGSVKVGIVMDDKIVTIEIATATIHDTTEAGLAEFIVNYMSGAAPSVQGRTRG